MIQYTKQLFIFLLINGIINMNFLCERKKENMEKFKEFISQNKKILISIVIVIAIILLIASISIYFATRPTDEQESAEQQNQVQEVEDEEIPKAEAEIENSDIITSETEDTIAKDNQEQANENSKPTDSTSGNNSNNSSNANAGGNSSNSNTSEPSHTHTWVDHTATKQVWISNMVTIDDYETKTIYGAQFYTVQADGSLLSNGPTYWFENGFTNDDLKDIMRNALVQNPQGIVNGICYAQYVNRTKTEKIKVGSHQEDHGHYENQSYVDYQYCSECGEKKQDRLF